MDSIIVTITVSVIAFMGGKPVMTTIRSEAVVAVIVHVLIIVITPILVKSIVVTMVTCNNNA